MTSEPPREGPRAPVFNLATELRATVTVTAELAELLGSIAVTPPAQPPTTPPQSAARPQQGPPGAHQTPPACVLLQKLVSGSARAEELIGMLEQEQCEAFAALVAFVSTQDLGAEVRIYERQYTTNFPSVREDMLATFGFPIVEAETENDEATRQDGCWIRFTNPPP